MSGGYSCYWALFFWSRLVENPQVYYSPYFIFHLKLSSWSFTWCWSWWFFRIKSNLDKLIKRNIWAKTKWNKFKEVIKVFICENSIINALEFAIEINSPFERTYLRPIMISRDNFTNLHLSFCSESSILKRSSIQACLCKFIFPLMP